MDIGTRGPFAKSHAQSLSRHAKKKRKEKGLADCSTSPSCFAPETSGSLSAYFFSASRISVSRSTSLGPAGASAAFFMILLAYLTNRKITNARYDEVDDRGDERAITEQDCACRLHRRIIGNRASITRWCIAQYQLSQCLCEHHTSSKSCRRS